MKVELMAHTMFNGEWCPVLGRLGMEWKGGTSAEALIEFAGRTCYQSYTNPANRTNAEYIRNIIEHGHGSVLEHASATFFITGVSRSLTHELIRHRHLSFSELSQRYVNVEEARFVVPPAIQDEGVFTVAAADLSAKTYYKDLVKALEESGLPRKQVREAARSVIPNACETKIVVTGNFRAWRGFIDSRANEHADAEICALACEVARQLKERFPAVFSDYRIEGGVCDTDYRKV